MYIRVRVRSSAQAVCEPGFYCAAGVKYQCPAGTFGDAYGATALLGGCELWCCCAALRYCGLLALLMQLARACV